MPKKPISSAVERVHVTDEHVTTLTLTPPHAPRVETEAFKEAARQLKDEQDTPCFICGVRLSDLRDPARKSNKRVNPYGATQMEAHHYPIERSFLDGVDVDQLAVDYPEVREAASLEAWVDSKRNIRVLCDQCHRLAPHAHHRALMPVILATKYAKRDEHGTPYVFATDQLHEHADEAIDEHIEVAVEAALSHVAS